MPDPSPPSADHGFNAQDICSRAAYGDSHSTDSSISGEEFQMLQLQMPMGMPFITEKWRFQLLPCIFSG